MVTTEERLREIRSVASCEDTHVAISDLADCMIKINERLKRIENRGLPDGVGIAEVNRPRSECGGRMVLNGGLNDG